MSRPRVVLAEDHPTIAKALQRLLEEEYEVVEVATNGRDLVEIVRRTVPDLIVSDISMPAGDGFAAAAAILAHRPAARIVFVTIESAPAVIQAALDLGALGYVLKRDAGDELVAAARSAIGGTRFLSSNARRALAESENPGGSFPPPALS